MKNNTRKHKGFTLLEIIAVISLLIVISSMAIPSYIHIVDNQKKRADLATALQLTEMAKTYYIEKKDTTTSKLREYISKNFNGEYPKAKYNDAEFEVSFDSDKKVNVSISKDGETINLVTAGKPNEELQ